VLVVPILLIAYFAAPIVLKLFGQTYVAGTIGPLRWLIVAGFVTMLNYVTGTVLFLAKKSLLITVVNVLDAVLVIGMAIVWATNAEGVAISWVVGDVANTVCFGVFALFALREVGGRWEDLGEKYVQPVAPTRLREKWRYAPTGAQLRTVDVLLALAEDQRVASQYEERERYPMTSPSGMFSIMALRRAEEERRPRAEPAATARHVPPPEPSTAAQMSGLDALFKMAERQRRSSRRREHWR
jgi:hypothetical protein